MISNEKKWYTTRQLSTVIDEKLSVAQINVGILRIMNDDFKRYNDHPERYKYGNILPYAYKFKLQHSIATQKFHSIACDENGKPMENAEVVTQEKRVNVYRLLKK